MLLFGGPLSSSFSCELVYTHRCCDVNLITPLEFCLPKIDVFSSRTGSCFSIFDWLLIGKDSYELELYSSCAHAVLDLLLLLPLIIYRRLHSLSICDRFLPGWIRCWIPDVIFCNRTAVITCRLSVICDYFVIDDCEIALIFLGEIKLLVFWSVILLKSI